MTNSVTGDKKAAKFEDDFLDELFEMLKEEGVRGVTYMPARNTREQLTRLQELCRRYGMTEISGEDVNSSRQSMICPQLVDPQFEHLVDMAWKLVEREKIRKIKEKRKSGGGKRKSRPPGRERRTYMKTKALRLYGKEDLRLEEFELPEPKEDEILAKVVSDSICMSSYKAAMQGADHKRVPDDVAEHPTIIGHEFCGELVKVGSKWADEFKAGEKFSIQPALNYKGSLAAPGYSYQYIGGDATYVIIPTRLWRWDACSTIPARAISAAPDRAPCPAWLEPSTPCIM